MKKIVSVCFFMLLFICVKNTFAEPLDKADVPSDLAPWIPWVMHSQEEKFCPEFCNQPRSFQCAWPAQLKIAAAKEGGQFTQDWTVFAKTWIPLPGSAERWPEKVLTNRVPTAVILRKNTPSLFLKPGNYSVSGEFHWKDIPEILQIPAQTGLLSLSIGDREVPFPVLDLSGRLWLQKREISKSDEDRQEVTVFRKITDEIPLKILSMLQLNISGQAREIRLEQILPEGSIPLALSAPFPVRIGEKGEILAQVRPGKWEIRIETRFPRPTDRIGPVSGAYGQEIWVFQARNDLRLVEIQGPPSIDPSRTGLPDDWKSLPAYLMDKDASLTVKQIRRGNEDPAPDRLQLQRTWWLDFDGKGFTVQDQIRGTMSRNWSLFMLPSASLGRVSVNGTDQLITMQNGKQGVEIRQGSINLTAESRVEKAANSISATGWDHDFEKVSATLHLPPGWKLFAQNGADTASGTWLHKWTLLDIFLILIISVGTFKLRNPLWGLTAMLCLTLIWHENEAPRHVWLHILIALGLLRVLPEGKIRNLVRMWGIGAGLVLLVLSIPFMVHQIRHGMYPQLEYPWKSYDTGMGRSAKQTVSDAVSEAENYMQSQDRYMQKKAPEPMPSADKSSGYSYKRKQAVFTHDPNANVQTGPGLPAWDWNSANIQWNGPVSKSQEIRFWLISPSMNLIFAFVRVIFLALFIFGLLDVRKQWNLAGQKLSAVTICALIFLCSGMMSQSRAAGFPSQEILKELETKLIKPHDCQPSCAVFSHMELRADADHLELRVEVHTAQQTGVPLPGSLKSWMPKEIWIDGLEMNTVIKDSSGILWVLVPEGIHMLTLKNQTGPVNEIHLPMQMKPYTVTANVQGWELRGLDTEGRPEDTLQLTRIRQKEEKIAETGTDILPAFVEIERTLRLGIQWEVETTARRKSPSGTPVILPVPLLAGESVTTQGIQVKDAQAVLNMGPQQNEIRWLSVLERTDKTVLQAPDTDSWSEMWILDASPIWHLEFSGIPPIHQQDAQGLWKPAWRPWPKEIVELRISKPQAVEGQTVTIDQALLKWRPGKRMGSAGLEMRVRSSKGTRHTITLPEGAELKEVKIDKESKPIRQEGRTVSIPLKPGSQEIELQWQENRAVSFMEKGPEIHIGERAVNAKVQFDMPRDRWILLTGGPKMGPAVLFWSYLFVIALAAAVLGRIPLTPLKTRHWALLGLGLTQIHALGAILVVVWFLALGVRKKADLPKGWFVFNLMQFFLAALSLAAMICFYLAIKNGLLGVPEMQISGNGSGSSFLCWTQDRIDGNMPIPWALSLPRFTYHIFMLVWSLWLATALVRWLRWGWECFAHETLWKKADIKFGRKTEEEKPIRSAGPPPLKTEVENRKEKDLKL
ncbi:MAG: hypothetical protein R2941_09865 [Desulfobacterales bacterium]